MTESEHGRPLKRLKIEKAPARCRCAYPQRWILPILSSVSTVDVSGPVTAQRRLTSMSPPRLSHSVLDDPNIFKELCQSSACQGHSILVFRQTRTRCGSGPKECLSRSSSDMFLRMDPVSIMVIRFENSYRRGISKNSFGSAMRLTASTCLRLVYIPRPVIVGDYSGSQDVLIRQFFVPFSDVREATLAY